MNTNYYVIGDVLSWDDSSCYKISNEINIADTVKLSVYINIIDGPNKKHCPTFLLSSSTSPPYKEDSHRSISEYWTYLHNNPMKAGLCYFDSQGSTALMTTVTLKGIKFFQCTIIDLKVVGGKEQQAAASHYNELKRTSSTRHLSHIYHLRNMNNLIKTETINACTDRMGKLRLSKMPSANNQHSHHSHHNHSQGGLNSHYRQPSKGCSVIDFGCGMGGDIFKWLKVSSGVDDIDDDYDYDDLPLSSKVM